MKLSDLPSETFPIPFANSAGLGYIRQIPVNSQIGVTNGAASLTDGFPPLTFLPVGSGGIPPFGQDFNGIINQITQWTKWQNAGGLVVYNSAFSTAIGGYPQGALLSSATAGLIWLNLADNNTTNPDGGSPANWVGIPNIPAIQTNAYNWAGTFGGNSSSYTATLAPAPTLAAGLVVEGIVGTTNVGAVTLVVNGTGKPLVRPGGIALAPGDTSQGAVISAIYDGTQFQLLTVPSLLLANVLTLTTVGTSTWTVPAGVYRISVRLWAAGGGSGGAYNGGNSGGGGAGGYAEGIYSVTPGQVISYTIGAGGTAGAATSSPTDGGTGGSSSFGSLLSAIGGQGGRASNGSGVIALGGGGGGGVGGNVINVVGGSASGGLFGVGAGGGNGGGAYAIPGVPAGGFGAAGVAGSIPGGGAAGTGAPADTSNYPGGVGGRGQIIIQY